MHVLTCHGLTCIIWVWSLSWVLQKQQNRPRCNLAVDCVAVAMQPGATITQIQITPIIILNRNWLTAVNNWHALPMSDPVTFKFTKSQQWQMLSGLADMFTTDILRKLTEVSSKRTTATNQCFIYSCLHATEPHIQWCDHVIKTRHRIIESAAALRQCIKPLHHSQLPLLSRMQATAKISYIL